MMLVCLCVSSAFLVVRFVQILPSRAHHRCRLEPPSRGVLMLHGLKRKLDTQDASSRLYPVLPAGSLAVVSLSVLFFDPSRAKSWLSTAGVRTASTGHKELFRTELSSLTTRRQSQRLLTHPCQRNSRVACQLRLHRRHQRTCCTKRAAARQFLRMTSLGAGGAGGSATLQESVQATR